MPVNIHGKEYYTVVERLKMLKSDFKIDYSLTTDLLKCDDKVVVMKATLKIGDNVYTGHAMEKFGSNKINTSSALENAETSSIGRALASAGYAGTEFASAEEVATAIAKQESGYKMKSPDGGKRPMTGLATEKQIGYIRKLNSDKGLYSTDDLEVELMNLTKERASQLIDGLMNTDNSVDEDDDVGAVKVGEVKPEEIPF